MEVPKNVHCASSAAGLTFPRHQTTSCDTSTVENLAREAEEKALLRSNANKPGASRFLTYITHSHISSSHTEIVDRTDTMSKQESCSSDLVRYV